MPPVMDLMEVSRRTELPIRRLRYVLEHRVLPGAEKASRGHRIAREFTAFECFGIACAAAMLQAGLRRPLVQRCVRSLLRPVRDAARQDNHLALIQRSSGAVVVEIADGDMIRVSGAPGQSSGWIPLAIKDDVGTRTPLAVVRVNVGAIRDALKNQA